MSPQSILALLLAAPTAPTASGEQPITASNWQRHPAIVEVRAIYREIREAETGRLRKEKRTFEYCRPYAGSERALYVDAGGAVRSYHVGMGSDDSAIQLAYYYDRDGALRFIFATAGRIRGKPSIPTTHARRFQTLQV